MELLKVFVGTAAGSGATKVENMVKGDLLLVNATDNLAWTSGDARIAGCNENGVYFSTPIKKANIKWSGYVGTTPYTPKVVTFTPASGDLVASTTYTLGVQIKEDLRMGTYNKNTEILASYTASSATPTVAEITGTLAKGFSANPLSSSGSPYQLVKVVRTGAGTVTGLAATVVPGGRQVTFGSAHGRSVGHWVSLDGAIYQIEKVDSTTVVTLDTAYQGTTTSLTSGTAQATGTSGHFTAATPTGIAMVFSAVAQTQKNRYDQFRVVEFDVIYPKGWVASSPVVTTSTVLPVGSYRQVRDLEEKAYTNANPLINYREFPFQTFPINADSTINAYGTFTVVYDAGWGYNMMQSSNPIFPQTVVVCAPIAIDGQFDSAATGVVSFAEAWASFATATLLDGTTFPNPSAP